MPESRVIAMDAAKQDYYITGIVHPKKLQVRTGPWKTASMRRSPANGKASGDNRMAEEKIVLKGRKVIGGVAEGEALVSKMPLMGWGSVKVKEGMTVERNHPLYEVPFKGKVLVFRGPRGSAASSAMAGRSSWLESRRVSLYERQ